jgi:MFS superfamily sulfate permease-like transporter
MENIESLDQKIYKVNRSLLVAVSFTVLILGLLLFYFWIDQNLFKAIAVLFLFSIISLIFFRKSMSHLEIEITSDANPEPRQLKLFAVVDGNLTESKAFSYSFFVIRSNITTSHWPFLRVEGNRIELSNIFLN